MRKLTARAVPYQMPGYPDYLAALLHARGVMDQAQAERFLNPDASQLHNPFLMHGMEAACALIHGAAQEKQLVAVYGDYDADGVCACAILLSALAALGIQAFPYIPARLSEGYGINAEAIQALAPQAKLLISVDCGITAVNEVLLARRLGMRVILTDHHTLPDTLPQADAIIHPQLAGYPEPSLCGAGVAWKLACALLGTEKAMNSLDLAALATVADLVPLQGENRVIVSLGLKALMQTTRPGLKALMRVSGMKEGAPVQSEHVAYQLAPRLNAGGRLATAQEALNLLITEDAEEAASLAAQLDLLNRERREVEQQALREASAQLAQVDLSRFRSIVLCGTDWNPGVVGLTAGKLAERWNYPSIVLTRNGGELTGSGRSAGGVDLHAALQACAPLLSRFGGHRMAAGLALAPDSLEAFRQCFDQAVRHQLGQEDLVPETVYDTVLPLQQVNLDTVRKLEQLAPFGLGNPSPAFLIEGLSLVSARAVGADAAHLKLTVAQNGAVREGIAFGQGRSLAGLGQDIALVGSVDQNEFNGRVSAQLKVKALLPGRVALAEDALAQARAILAALTASPDPVQMDAGSVRQVEGIPQIEGSRGTLLVAYTAQTANELHARFPYWMVVTGNAADPRAFHAILYAPDWTAHFAGYHRLVFADGVPCEQAAMAALLKTGAREALCLTQSAALQSFLKALAPSLEELRGAFQALRSGRCAGLTDSPHKDLAALKILEQLGLVQLDAQGQFVSLKQSQRVDPENSPLYRALARKEQHGQHRV